jgi:low affinity Fe/Cu permease
MTTRRNKTTSASFKSSETLRDALGHLGNGNGAASHLFSRLASRTAHLAGKPVTFLIAVAVVLGWAISGPFFGFSDTWQLVINTSTTIITFLMVFLIQNTQNRDTLALQLKLAELIIAMRGAKDDLATAEDLSEEDLEKLHEIYRKHAEETLGHLERRRDRLKKAS